MRGSLVLAVAASALVGLGLAVRPGERRNEGDRIVVVRGAAPGTDAARVASLSEPSERGWSGSPAAAASAAPPDDGGASIWATPAEFAPVEPAG